MQQAFGRSAVCLGSYQSVVHSHTLPIMSTKPYPFAGNALTDEERSYPSLRKFCHGNSPCQVLSQQYENVTLEQSKNVPLTGSDWTGAGRTAIDEPSREGPVGDIAQGEEEGHHASGSSGRVGRERAACEAAVEGAEETR